MKPGVENSVPVDTIVISEPVLTQLYARFLLNLPDWFKEELNTNFIRIFFELESAHWFYLDHFITDPKVGGINFVGFCNQIFAKFPTLIPRGLDWHASFNEWREYRGSTPTGSAIILDEKMEKVLLVQGFHANRWSFPGGKVNEKEKMSQCAIREVMEETGLDIEPLLDINLYLDRSRDGTLRRSFIIEGIPHNVALHPKTKNEIEAITWFELIDLPIDVQDSTPVRKLGIRPNQFYVVLPYINQLKNYVLFRNGGEEPRAALRKSEQLERSIRKKNLAETPLKVMQTQAKDPAAITLQSQAPKAAKKLTAKKFRAPAWDNFSFNMHVPDLFCLPTAAK